MKLPPPKYQVTADQKHKYTIQKPDGSLIGPLISVTTICDLLNKPALKGWAARMASDYFKAELLRLGKSALTPDALDKIANAAKTAYARTAKDAADLGTACHAIFEAILKGQEPEQIPPELAEPARDFKRWRLSTDIEIVAMELAVASLAYRYGGRVDAVGYSEQRGGWGIVDYKTSSGFYGNEYAYQGGGGYAHALEEQYGVKVKWCDIIRFGKKEPYDSEGRPVTNIDSAREAFLLLARFVPFEKQELIGAPTFTTVKERAAEKPKAVSKGKKAQSAAEAAAEAAVGF